ncbi:MAG: hypothetical protein JF589_09445 [Gemmatimonadetes bacterium]|jgi:hypothetical protein|nr:hypothetical protein [Gemmatimonadota bacterium]
MRKNYRISADASASASGKMHDLSQIARLEAKSRRRMMTESVGRFGRITPTDRHSPGSVTGTEAD